MKTAKYKKLEKFYVLCKGMLDHHNTTFTEDELVKVLYEKLSGHQIKNKVIFGTPDQKFYYPTAQGAYFTNLKSSANFRTKKLWLRDVRRRWVQFRKLLNDRNESPWYGCSYYPPEVRAFLYEIVNEFKEIDRLMCEYYKEA